MRHDTHTQRVLDLVAQKGMLRPSDLDDIAAPRVVLTRMTANGLLEKAGRGIYRLPGNPGSEHESLVTIATKVPQAMFCLLTALQFHELTTQLPREVWISMPRGSRHAPVSRERGVSRDRAASVRARRLNIASVEADDGIVFDPATVSVEEIRKDAGYAGARVLQTGELAKARCSTVIKPAQRYRGFVASYAVLARRMKPVPSA